MSCITSLEGYSPEEIQAQLPTLSLKDVYATITYYLYNRTEVHNYLSRLESWQERRYQEGRANPTPVVTRLRKLKVERSTAAHG